MTDNVSLTELRTLTRQRADMQNSQFVDDTELTRYLNNSWGELYNLIIDNFNEDYYTTTNTFTLTSGTDSYSLPSDFYKLRGVDLVVTTTESVPLRRYNWAERTRNSVTVRARDYRYRVQKGSIVFTPVPSTNDSIKIFYIPSPRKLESVTPSGVTRGSTTTYTVSSHSFVADDVVNVSGFLASDYNSQQTVQSVTSTTIVTDLDSSALSAPTSIGTVESVFDFYAGWDEYIIVDSALKMLVKEEQDVTGLMVQKNMLKERIITESQNRDAGEPQTVTDVVAYHKFYYA